MEEDGKTSPEAERNISLRFLGFPGAFHNSVASSDDDVGCDFKLFACPFRCASPSMLSLIVLQLIAVEKHPNVPTC